MSRAERVKHQRHRSVFSEAGWRDELDQFTVPAPMYYVGRSVWRHKAVAGVLIAVWALWAWTGSLVGGVLLLGVSVGTGLTGWVLWQRSRAEGAAFSVRDALAVRRQRATLQRQWPLACKTAGLVGPERRTAPQLRQVRATGDGSLEATVESGRIGVPVPSIQKQTVTLAEVVGCREVVVTQTAPGVATLAFHWRDPVGRHLPLADLPIAPKETLAYGIRQDGSVATVRLSQSILIGGLTRAGKSTLVLTLLADAIRQRVPVRLYISDPKGGVELDTFERQLGETGGLVEVRAYAKTPAETVKMIEAVEKAMHARQHWMKANGARKIVPDAVNPLVVLILDETLPLTDILKRGTDSALGRVAYTGAAAGYVVWANTQVAQVDAIGRFRDLIPQRICFSTPNTQVTDSVLGQGSESAGARCSEIRQPGVGFSYSEGQHTPRKFRAAYVTDDEAALIAMGRLPREVVERAEVEAGERAGETALYRWFYADDPPGSPPQYVGISYDVLRREAEHDQSLRAFMDGDVRREVQWWPTRKAAAAAEKVAIESEKPTFNIIYNHGPNRRTDRRRRDKADVAA